MFVCFFFVFVFVFLFFLLLFFFYLFAILQGFGDAPAKSFKARKILYVRYNELCSRILHFRLVCILIKDAGTRAFEARAVKPNVIKGNKSDDITAERFIRILAV